MIIEDAILEINPNAKFVRRGNDIDTCEIEWLEGTSEISKDDIKLKIAETEYKRKRVSEYPSIGDQLDNLYKDILAGTLTSSGTFAKAIEAVKAKYPKP